MERERVEPMDRLTNEIMLLVDDAMLAELNRVWRADAACRSRNDWIRAAIRAALEGGKVER